MAHARVGKWGNDLTVRLPGYIVRQARLRDGEHVEIEAQAGAIVIRRRVLAGGLFDACPKFIDTLWEKPSSLLGVSAA